LSPPGGKPHGLRELLSGLLLAASSIKRISSARLSAVQKLETLAWQFRIQGWNVALGASGTIKAAQEVLVAMGEKDGFITPERLEMLVEELLKYKNFDSLSLPGI
jgi:exopolyphosphatase/guanosine-5'-triphosphate,3'-diphosphate pyrophosphatase